MDKLLSKIEVCELLGISRPTLDRIVAAGELPAIRIRSAVRFDRADVMRYLAACRSTAPRAKKTAAAQAPPTKGKPGRPKGSTKKKPEIVYYPGMRVV